jgi:hypothetical protein
VIGSETVVRITEESKYTVWIPASAEGGAKVETKFDITWDEAKALYNALELIVKSGNRYGMTHVGRS